MTHNDSESLQDSLSRAKRVLIVTHSDPDLDAIGSSLALHYYLDSEGIENVVWTDDPLMPSVSFLPGIDRISNHYPQGPFDTLVVLDSSDINRVPSHEKLNLETFDQIINIDHHPDNTRFGTVNIVENLSSVGEILTCIFKQLGWSISEEIATCLYAAIIFDTGRFLFSNMTAQTLALSSALIEEGADAYRISQTIYENKSLDSFQIMQIALEHLVVNDRLGYAYTKIPYMQTPPEFKVIDFIRQLGGPYIFFVAQELEKGKIKVNFRSKRDFNVSTFSAQFGGGGHERASGILMEGPLDAVIDQLETALKAQLIPQET